MLIVCCLLMEALTSLDPCQDVSSSFFSLERSRKFCRVCQQRSTPILTCPENVTAENLTGFGFVGLDVVNLWYGSTLMEWLDAPSKLLLIPYVLARIFPIAACRGLSWEVIDSSRNSTLWGVLGTELPMWVEQSRRSSIGVRWLDTRWSKR